MVTCILSCGMRPGIQNNCQKLKADRARINIACNNFYSRPKTLPSVNELNLNILFNFFYHILFTFLSFHLWDQSAVKNTPSLNNPLE